MKWNWNPAHVHQRAWLLALSWPSVFWKTGPPSLWAGHRWVGILLLDQARAVCLFSVGQYLNCKHPILVKEVFLWKIFAILGRWCAGSMAPIIHLWVKIWSCCCSVTQLGPTLCNPMDCSMPGFPVLHHLPELAQTHVHWVSDAIQSSLPLSSPSPAALQSFPAGSFLMSQLFATGGQNIGTAASASDLPINIQDWFPLGLTGLIFLQFKGLSRVFSNSTVQKHQFFSTQHF